MKRGEVHWYNFQSPDKRRPVLILTRDSILPYLNDVTIAPITSTIRGVASEVGLSIMDGMANDCAINFHHLQTVPKRKIGGLITTLTSKKLQEVGPALCFALGIDISSPI